MSRRPAGFWVFGIMTAVVVVGTAAVARTGQSRELAFIRDRLAMVSALRAAAVVEEMDKARSDALVWSGFGDLRTRIQDMDRAWQALGPDADRRLRRLYVEESPFPDGQRHLLTDAGDGSAYSREHADFHPGVDEFLAIHDYYDLFAVTPRGRVAYTFFKEEDFGEDLMDGPLSESGLGEAVRTAMGLGPGQVAVSGFEPYAPSAGEWSAFVASAAPLPDGRTGVLAFQVSARRLGERLESIEGRRGSTISWLVGDAVTILPGEPWARATNSDPGSLDRQVLDRVREGEAQGTASLIGAGGRAWGVAWEVVEVAGDRYVSLTMSDEDLLRLAVRQEQRALALVGFLIWLAGTTLTLGVKGRLTLGRHEI